MNLRSNLITLLCGICFFAFAQKNVLYQSKAYSIYPDKVVQGDFTSKATSVCSLSSNYRSAESQNCNPTISFKFSINCRDNEMSVGRNHELTLVPINGKCVSSVVFGEQKKETLPLIKGINLPENTVWTVQLDMRKVLNAFNTAGFYTLCNGEKLSKTDFKGVFIAGSIAPLMWDFNNLHTRQNLQLTDTDGDGIYETTLILNNKKDVKQTESEWSLSKNISTFPQYKSTYPISDAIYNLALEEMIKAVESDSTFRTGKEWAGVWTRDISYSIILSMAYLQPKVAKYSLMCKVKNNRIVQDTGTGGAYPVSTDRMIWAVAAWELYKTTGDKDWLSKAYFIIKNSIEDDLINAYDPETGLVRGESSFLDWREQTYPRWMQPTDIFNSENLGTNAVHFQANKVLAEMAGLLNEKNAVSKHMKIAEKIKTGINKYLWMKEYGYYGQYLYGRNHKTISPRSEALGEALCGWFGIADNEKIKTVVSKVPVMDYGIPCIYPQIPNIPPYHNNAVWPFVQSYWALASAKAGNEKAVLESFAAIYRPAALFLTNKENMVASTGDFAGTEINSSNMLWSLSGNLALVHRVLFGIEFETEGICFQPFVPKAFYGARTLTNFKYRKSILDINMQGFGNKIKRFELDGVVQMINRIPYSITGKHIVNIVLDNNEINDPSIHKTGNYNTVETPQVNLTNETLSWTPVAGAKTYRILKNGKQLIETNQNSLNLDSPEFSEYQVIAVDSNNICSFASEPVMFSKNRKPITCEFENFAEKSTLDYHRFNGNGFIEISKTKNKIVDIEVNILQTSDYSVCIRYSNGNGPVNTENKCAIRTLKIDGKFTGTLVFPQRGKSEWSNWGNSNFVRTSLTKGKHRLSIVLEKENENMNNTINQAMLDELYIFQLD